MTPAMKINGSEGLPFSEVARSGGPASAGESKVNTVSSGPSLAGDRVQLSNLSANLSATLGDSAAHFTKISSLGEAVLSGRYQVDAGAVSDSIIRNSLQVGGANYL
jgi:anti-sigma28 factor (negative regulator of flagellin synthesis)